MYNKEINNKQHSAWLAAALLAPVTQAASNCSWPATLVVAAICLLINYGMERMGLDRDCGRWLGAIQWLWMLPVISEFMHWIMYCWPDHGSYHVVPLVLLSLAAYSVAKGTPVVLRAGSALKLPILVLLGSILLAAIPEIRLENLRPQWQMQTGHLITVMLIPVMGFGYGSWKGKSNVIYYAAAVSVAVTGVLSLLYMRSSVAPFYDLSRSISFLGRNRRFESLVAAAMTMGYYVLLCYLLGITAKAWEPEHRRRRSIWISALFSAMVFVSGMRLHSRFLAVGNLLIWVIFPLLKNIVKNLKISVDK